MSNFTIYEVPIKSGLVGLSPIPGASGDFEADLSEIMAWHPDFVLSMTERKEFSDAGAADFPKRLTAAGIEWQPFPVADFSEPKKEADGLWAELEKAICGILSNGGRVLVHCKGGCGRSGMAVLRLMIASGTHPFEALTKLRAIRPCAVETEAQMVWAFTAYGKK